MGYTILIIGAAGKMGKWFFSYFDNIKNQTVKKCDKLNISKILVYDLKKINYDLDITNNNAIIKRSLGETINDSDIIIFCIPLKGIKSFIENNMEYFKNDSTIIEISSIKGPIFEYLREIFNKKPNMTILSIHPMYGPGASISSTNKMLYLPVNKNNRKLEEAKFDELFPQHEKIVIGGSDEHDFSIAIIISLVYFMNLVFSKLLSELNIEKVSYFLPKTNDLFIKEIQFLLCKSILTDDIFLFLMLFVYNNKSLDIIKKYSEKIKELLNKIEKKDENFITEYIKEIKNNISNDNNNNNNNKKIDSFKFKEIHDSIYHSNKCIEFSYNENKYLIGLVYFINLVFSNFLLDPYIQSNTNLQKLEEASGSTFKIQSAIYKYILEYGFDLNILYEKESLDIIKKYSEKIKELLNKIEKKDENFITEYINEIKNNISNDDVNESYKILYKFLN
ncbi:MAG TPA: prephenate dehydrogenase/arogenate dehydrogenase family protein [Candidatus Nitrosocosmicus sp.]